MFIITFKFN